MKDAASAIVSEHYYLRQLAIPAHFFKLDNNEERISKLFATQTL